MKTSTISTTAVTTKNRKGSSEWISGHAGHALGAGTLEVADEMVGFGPHLMLDGYGCDKKKLQDLNLVYRILDDLPERIGMTKIMPPYVFKYSGVKPEDWGLSGFVLIAESHVSIHTFPEKTS